MTWNIVGAPVTQANATNPNTYTLPAGYAVGDLLLLFARRNAHVVVTPPSGWTLLASETGIDTTSKWVVYGLVAPSTSVPAPQINWSGSSTHVGIALAVRDSNGVMSLGTIVGDPAGIRTGAPGATIPFPACTVAEDGSIVFIFGCITKNNDNVAYAAAALAGFTEAAEVNHANAYGSLGVLEYVIQTTKANISADSIGVTGVVAGTTNADGAIFYLKPTPAPAAAKVLELAAHESAAGAASVSGVVFAAPTGGEITGARIGEFTNKTFESVLVGGKAVLKVPVAEFGGGNLLITDTPVAFARNADFHTDMTPCTVVEV